MYFYAVDIAFTIYIKMYFRTDSVDHNSCLIPSVFVSCKEITQLLGKPNYPIVLPIINKNYIMPNNCSYL